MGKHKYIETPQRLWELFIEYKATVINNPIKKHVFVGKDGQADWELRDRPLTIEGFENWLEDNDIIDNLSNYFANSNNAYSDYSTICSRIKRNVRANQIEGGMAGIFNHSITQRLNGLKEQTENVNIEKQIFKDIDLNVNTDNGTIEDS